MKETLKNIVGDKTKMMQFYLDKQKVEELRQLTLFMDQPTTKNAHRVFAVINNINEIPKCPVCGLNAALNMTYHDLGWREYCGDVCSKKAKHRTKHLWQLKDADWLKEERVVKMRSVEDIANELGVSTIPVTAALKEFNITMDARKRNSIGIKKEDIISLYSETNNTMDDVANELGVSKSTISVMVSRFGIDVKESNSYDRKVNPVSSPQLMLYEFISQYFPDAVLSDRKTIGMEIDIYIPSKRFGIEYNGFPYHFYGWNDKDGTLHVKKTNKAEENGIQIFHVFPSDLYEKTEILESVLKNKLGVVDRRIYARACCVQEVSVDVKNKFLRENHIQGEDKSRFKYGLFFDGELLAVMTFGSSRFNTSVKWELVRFATKRGVTVVGGFSKLLACFRKEHFGCIVSYADRRYSIGSVYEKNGFDRVKVNKPAYYYVAKNSMRLGHRMKFQKKNLVGEGTEWEIMKRNGFNKVYDCGTITYILK